MVDVGTVFGHVGPGLGHELLPLGLVHEHVVHVGADLAGIELLDEHDPPHRFLQRVVRVDDRRGLAPQFQHHRREVLRRRGHYRAPGLTGAGEHQQVVGQF